MQTGSQGQHLTRIIWVKASNPMRALYQALIKCDEKDLIELKGVSIEEYPHDQPEPVPKEDCYYYVTHSEGNYYKCKATGKRVSVEDFKKKPDLILTDC